MNKPNHRIAAGTKAARQMSAANSKAGIVEWRPSATFTQQEREIADWNAEVERKKVAKKAGKV